MSAASRLVERFVDRERPVWLNYPMPAPTTLAAKGVCKTFRGQQVL